MPEDPSVGVVDVVDAALPETSVESGAEPSSVEPQITGETTGDVGKTGDVSQEPQKTAKDGEDLREFDRSVSARIREYVKKHPELNEIFKKDPSFRGALEASFRRDSAYRELFPTVAEARAFREALPGGIEELQSLRAEVDEIAQIDNGYTNRDPQGRYPEHARMVETWYNQDPQAFDSLVQTGIREWGRINPDAYNRTLSSIIGATLEQNGVLRVLDDIEYSIQRDDKERLTRDFGVLAQWLKGFDPKARPSQPTREQEQLKAERERFERERGQRSQEDSRRYVEQLHQDSVRQAKQLVESNMLIRKLPQSLSPQARATIVRKVMESVGAELGQDKTFTSELKAATSKLSLQAAMDVQRRYWSQPWRINRHIRSILEQETPAIVQRAKGGTMVKPGPQPSKASAQAAPAKTAPFQKDGRWYKPSGSPFTTVEILRGDHLRK